MLFPGNNRTIGTLTSFLRYCSFIVEASYHSFTELAYDYALFVFHGLYFATPLYVMKLELFFRMTSFNYGVKRLKDVNVTCKYHQSNIMPKSIFSNYIAQFVACGYSCLFVCFDFLLWEDIWVHFIRLYNSYTCGL